MIKWLPVICVLLFSCSRKDDSICSTPGNDSLEYCLCHEFDGAKIQDLRIRNGKVILSLCNQPDTCTSFCNAEKRDEWSELKAQKMMIALPAMIFGLSESVGIVSIEFKDKSSIWQGVYTRAEFEEAIGQQSVELLDGWKKARFQADVLQNKSNREQIFNLFVVRY